MAAARQRASHLEARLGWPTAGRRQIADDMEDAQGLISLVFERAVAGYSRCWLLSPGPGR